jgi:REP element-mobilizing transposase RayT
MIWLITFMCYGTRFHAPPALEDWERFAMTEPSYALDGPRRALTMRAVREICAELNCSLIAAHVRTTHIHVVADLFDADPADVTNAIKRRASRLLNASGFDAGRQKRWARHGRYEQVRDLGLAIRYVVERQGEVLEVFVSQG